MRAQARATAAILVATPLGVALLADCGPSSDCRELLQCPRQTTDGGGLPSGGAGGGQGGDAGQGGSGGLPEDLGTPCTSPSECSTNQCVDGVCCVSACDAPCESCAIDDALGLCTPHLAATDPETDCDPGTCDGASHCAVGDHVWSAQYGDAMSQSVADGDVDDAGNLISPAPMRAR